MIDKGVRGPTAYCIELVIVDHCQNPRPMLDIFEADGLTNDVPNNVEGFLVGKDLLRSGLDCRAQCLETRPWYPCDGCYRLSLENVVERAAYLKAGSTLHDLEIWLQKFGRLLETVDVETD
jgi:hypothetical protein